jgi:cell division protein FtsZ
VEEDSITEVPVPQTMVQPKEEEAPLQYFELGAAEKKETPKEEEEAPTVGMQMKFREEPKVDAEWDEEKIELERQKKALEDKFEALRQNVLGGQGLSANNAGTSQSSAAAGGYLSRPSNIYAENKKDLSTSKQADEPVGHGTKAEQDETFDMQLVIRNDENTEAPASQPAQTPQANAEDAQGGNAPADKQRATDRLQKLRNLSFNLNAADPNNEFENVPAYIRRNMELYQGTSSVENFYSNYSVKSDGKNSATISTINTFLDGKKPD